jgi:hypothetical protein
LRGDVTGKAPPANWSLLLPLDDLRPVVTKSWRRITPEMAAAAEEKGEHFQKDSLNSLHDIAANMERLNRDWAAEEEKLRKAGKILPGNNWSSAEEREIAGMLGGNHPVDDRLKAVARARRRFANMSNRPIDISEKSLFWLFIAVGTAAGLEHLYSHVLHHEWLLVLAGLLLVWGARYWVHWMRRRQVEPRGLDYRALAEALRVQIYWAAAGLGRSVPANYLLRARSQLDYLRNVVTVWALPYEQLADSFGKMPEKEKYERMCRVHDGWVR